MKPYYEEFQEHPMSLGDYFRILYRGRWIILCSFLVVMGITLYLTYSSMPVYEASALVMLKEEGKVQRELFDATSYMDRSKRVNNQVEILRSRTLAKEVIKRLVNSSQADSLWILGNRERTNNISFTNWFLSIFKPNHNATANYKVYSMEDLVSSFRKGAISVLPKRDTDMIELKVESFSPFEASLIVNTWAEAYRDMDIDESREEVTEVIDFLDDKLLSVKDDLTHSEEDLKQYKESHQVAELTAETEQLIKQSAEFETMYEGAKTDLEANERRLAHLKAQLSENQRRMVDEASSLSTPVILELQKQMAKLVGDMASYEQQLKGAGLYSVNDQKLKNMNQRLKGLKEKIVEETRKSIKSGIGTMNPLDFSESLLTSILELESENTSLRAKTETLQSIVWKNNQSLNSLPEKSLRLARLQREAKVNNNIYMMLREKFEENRIAEAGQIGSIRIVDWSDPSRNPVKPNIRLNIIFGLLIGFGLGIVITFLREYLDSALKTVEDIERLGFPVMGAIPYISPDKISKHGKGTNRTAAYIASRLITHNAPKSHIAEAYRSLRTNILYARVDDPIKTILVTSPGPGEGKSTSAANLAITFAQMGTRTLLIDTDLRRPVLDVIFRRHTGKGLIDVLVGTRTLDDAIEMTRIRNLFLLSSGRTPVKPSEFLASKRMEKLIKKIQTLFDLIIFDSPPIIPVTDAAILGTKMDGIVMVVKAGETDREALVRSRIILENVNANILGVLINGIKSDYMYGSYYYHYSYSEKGKSARGQSNGKRHGHERMEDSVGRR